MLITCSIALTGLRCCSASPRHPLKGMLLPLVDNFGIRWFFNLRSTGRSPYCIIYTLHFSMRIGAWCPLQSFHGYHLVLTPRFFLPIAFTDFKVWFFGIAIGNESYCLSPLLCRFSSTVYSLTRLSKRWDVWDRPIPLSHFRSRC